jgi:Na+/melibiose symporter-like transporter
VLGAVQAASSIGQVVVMALPAIVTLMGWGTFADGVHVMGWTIFLSLPVCVAIMALSVREPANPAPQERLGFQAALKALASNEPLRRVLIPDFLVGAAQGMAGTLFIFYAAQVAGLSNPSAYLLVYFGAGLLGAPLWTWLGRRLGKHTALQVASIFWAISLTAIVFLPRGAETLAFVLMALSGIPAVAGTMLLRAMMADVADEDEAMTGQQRSGLFYGLLLTTTKVGLAMGPASLMILAPFGFNGETGAHNGPAALLALTLLFAGGPAVLNLLTALSLHKYPLDAARQHALRDAIKARSAPSASPGQP